ncbi:MAG: ABC transporter substrate-binding protein [Moraxellaceae bacterium]|nr:ABC transporter substrate-binding protein [Moraxellaceae bacterium]
MRNKTSLKFALALASAGVVAMPAMAQTFSEAPELAALVKEKKLPPVAQRLPEKPQVITPLERSGKYGGTLRNALRGNGDQNAILRVVGNQGLVRWSMDFNKVEPNVAESWTLSPDGSEYTFKLRKGMKWSDGSPFTADDVVFSMNDVVGNKEFLSSPPPAYVINNKYVAVTKVDNETVKFKFDGPYVGFIEQLATPVLQHPTLWSKNYCQKFHPKYNSDVSKAVADAKLKGWSDLFRRECADIEPPAGATRFSMPNRPTLDPWIVSEPYSGSSTRVVLKRNPYFWQVDKEGKQLPYIDTVQLSVISEVETIVLNSINGSLDWQLRHISNIQNRPVLAENAAKGGYRLVSLPNINASSLAMYVNQTSPNAKLREQIRKKDFRIALSLATDRKEINDIVFLGQGAPWQVGPLKQSKWYNEKLGTQFIQYDLKKANEMLDTLGLNKKDNDGFRLYPTGGRVSINVIASIANSHHIEGLELIRRQWAKAGIDMVIQSSERTLFYDRAARNEYDISVDNAPGGMDAPFNPRAYLSQHPQESRQSLLWQRWWATDGKQGEEPSASMKKRFDLFEKWQKASSQAQADATFKEILAEAAEAFEVIGTVRPAYETGVVNNKLINVYDKMPSGWTYPTPGPALLQQWSYR